MKVKTILATLLLAVAGLQTAWAQGFRVYQSDGTELQFSLKTDSIVFDNGLSGDEVFGPFTPVNLCIAKKWYKSKSETVTFHADGTTDYMQGATYKFFPYQGNVIIYNASGAPVSYFKVLEVTPEHMVVAAPGSESLSLWSNTQPVQLVTSIVLSETSVTLQPDETKRLTATVYPEDADNSAVTWESSNDGVAEVNQSGRITANANGTCTITCSATDGSGVKAECQVSVATGNSGSINGRAYVDLGLPSGTLWATCNVGASSPEEYGDYFAWGETEGYNSGKMSFVQSTYKWCEGSSETMTKYSTNRNYGYNGFTDGLTELLPEDDAATANWGADWQMPSFDQIKELYNSSYTTTTWTTQNGVNGRKITSKSNGNSIFLPAAGQRFDTNLDYAGKYGLYFSRSLFTNLSCDAWYLYFDSGGVDCHRSIRYAGRSVRPVRVL